MTTLALGVNDIPYAAAPAAKAEGMSGAETTGDVAEILEAKYGIMAAFVESRRGTIQGSVVEAYQGAIETLLLGGTATEPLSAAAQEIQSQFREFLSSGAVEQLGIPGVPTEAALRGVNHRLKRPYRKGNPRRPSFIDTGLYEASMAAEFK